MDNNKLKVRDRFVQSPLATAQVKGVAATLRARQKKAVEVMARFD